MSRIILFICDGMSDVPIKGKTPLQKARTPNMDRMAREGQCGLMHTIGRGIIPGSDTAHLALFGYDPRCYYKGRGVFEALGAGMKLRKGDVAFRANFATVSEKMVVKDRRAGRIRKGTEELARALDGMMIRGVRFTVKPTTEHRAVVVMRGKGLSSCITDTDPHKTGKKVLLSKACEMNANRTAKLLNEFTKKTYDILRSHPINKRRENAGKPPANILLCRGASRFERIPSLKERFGIDACCIAGGALYKGVASFVGMNVVNVKGATGREDTDVNAKVDATLRCIQKNDFIFLHVKGCDNLSHDGDFNGKVKMIERIDKALGRLMREVHDTYIILTSDHTTPVWKREHSFEPVPLVIWGEHLRVDDVKRFDEISCAKGSLGHLMGMDLMPIMLSLMGVSEKYGS